MKTAESLIQEKSFQELSAEEMALVMELVEDEQSFNDMKRFFSELDTYTTSMQVEPSSKVKASLNEVFRAKHPGISIQANAAVASAPVTSKEVSINRTIWFRIAAVLVLFIGIALYLLQPESKEVVQTAKQDMPITSETTTETKEVAPEDKPTETLLAKNETVTPQPVDVTAADVPVYTMVASIDPEMTVAGSAISHAERGMSADLFVNSDKDLASKSFAQPIAPDVLMQFLEPAF
ncbi:MAG: hypothetical protein ACOVO3_11275 [Fluviicola sp.]